MKSVQLLATLFFISCVVVLISLELPARADLSGGVGVLGDSNSDEYRADDNRGGSFAATTLNWVELLSLYRGLDFGEWGTWGGPRRIGYKYNWSRSAARVADMISSGQHTGLAAQVAAGEVAYVVINIGVNDFHVWNGTYADIYNGTLSDTQVQNKVTRMLSDMTLAVDTIQAAGPVPILVNNLADPGIHPTFQQAFPDPLKRQRVSNAIVSYNQGLAAMAVQKGISIVDAYNWAINFFATRVDANGYINIGGELIDTQNLGDEPHHFQLGDSVGHPGTIANSLMANEHFIQPLATFYNHTIAPFTEQEMLINAGIVSPATPIPTSTPVPSATSTTVPTATPIPTSTPVPSATSTTVPTATPIPTSTPVPSATSTTIPTATPIPTSTPVPPATSTTVPTTPPIPTSTPRPIPSATSTIVPTVTPAIYYPTSHTVTTGSYDSGTINDVTSDNNVYLRAKSQTSGLTRYIRDDFTFVHPGGLPSSYRFAVRTKSSTSSVNQRLYVYNNSASRWDLFSEATISTSENTHIINITTNRSNYRNAQGQIKLRIQVYKGLTTHTLYSELVSLTANP